MASEVIEFQLARQRLGVVSDAPIALLSAREREVLSLVAAGKSDAEIAAELFISKKTASVHVSSIKGKLGAATRVEIATLALRMGLVDQGVPRAAAIAGAERSARKPVMCPFKGLARFEVADARFFFGRERSVAELVARLAGSTFVGVVGPSGSGKSSVVRAGLVPALTAGVLPGSEGWTAAVARPGSAPAREIPHAVRAALGRRGHEQSDEEPLQDLLDELPVRSRLLLVVDQFEELFTVCQDEDEREAFVRDLVTATRDRESRALVVVVVRADFYGRCAVYRDLAELLAANHVLVGAMTAEELVRAVELPARAAGLRVEPELSAALVADVLDEPGGLPLLSTTLLDLWQRREGRAMRLATYELIGGVSGAVSRLAESAFARLNADEQDIARAIFLRLAAPGGGDVVGRPAPRRELDADREPHVARVLDVLTDSRLVAVADGVVEVAHEALLREWPRLRDWLAEDAEGRRLHAHLSRAAQEWELAGGDTAELYRGARLAAALEWWEDHDLQANELERRFLAESRVEGEREMNRQRRINRRLRRLLARAEAGEASARASEELARSRELTASALAFLDDDPSLSKLLALAASSTADPPLESLSMLHRAMAADPVIFRYSCPEDDAQGRVFADLDSSGRLIVATRPYDQAGHNYLEVVDRIEDRVLWSFRPNDASAAVGLGLFSPDGRYVVAGVFRDPYAESDAQPQRELLGIYVWNAADGELLQGSPIDVGACGGFVTAVSESHVLVRTKESPTCFEPLPDPNMTLELVDLRSDQRRTLTRSAFGDAESLSADGRYAAFDDADGPSSVSVVLDLRTSERLLEIPLEREGIDRVRDLSRDGSLLLYGDDPIQVWDVAAGEKKAAFDRHSNFSNFARFASSGATVFSTGRDAGLRHWMTGTGEQLFAVSGIGGNNGRPTATSDGLVLIPQTAAGSAVLVNTGVRGELGSVVARDDAEADWLMLWDSLRFSHPFAAFADLCNGREVWTMRVVDVTRPRMHYLLPSGGGDAGVEISPDGTLFVRQEAAPPATGPVGAMYGPLKIWSLAAGQEIRELQGLCSYKNLVDSPENVGECRAFPETPFPIWASRLRWSPDGSLIAAVPHPSPGWGGFVAVWNARDGTLLPTKRLDDGLFVEDAIFTPDSKHLIVSIRELNASGVMVEKWSTDDWHVAGERITLEAGRFLSFVGFAPDGSTLYAISGFRIGGAALHWIDAATLEELRPRRDRIHDANALAMAQSADGSLLATGATDGFVRVWSAATGALEHEISFGTTEVEGVAFITETRLAVVLADGNLRLVTIDKDELLDLVRDSLTRGYTESECERFNFGDQCPSLAELREG